MYDCGNAVAGADGADGAAWGVASLWVPDVTQGLLMTASDEGVWDDACCL